MTKKAVHQGKKESALLLANYVEPASILDKCGEVYDRFNNQPELLAIPVIKNGKPMGLLKRMDFLIHLASRYGRPLYGNQSVTVLMDDKPLIVETDTTIEDLNKLIMTEKQSAIQEGFIVIQNGVYHGVGSALNLIQANMDKVERQLYDVEKARTEAEAASDLKTKFLANMSHELRTPLNAIIGFSELILQQNEGSLPFDKMQNYVGDIRDSGTHLLKVINGILDMSKIESGVYELNKIHEDPEYIAEQAVRMVTAQAQKKNINVIQKKTNVFEDIYVDSQVVLQILLNLLTNAVKFSKDDTNVTLDLKQDTVGNITYAVTDEGMGIEKSKITEMMKPFTQVECVFSRTNEGTGLGLPLVAAFVEAHGGTFELDSEIGKGTTASVFLPAQVQEETVLQSQYA